MKIKILIVAAIFLFSTYSMAHASNFAQFSAMGEENQLPEATLEETVETAEKPEKLKNRKLQIQ